MPLGGDWPLLLLVILKVWCERTAWESCLMKHEFDWVWSAGNKYISQYCGLGTTLPRLDIPYSQDARLPSSPVTYAPGRCLTPALREAFIYLPARVIDWADRPVIRRVSFFSFAFAVWYFTFILSIYLFFKLFYNLKRCDAICFPGALGDVHDLRTGRIPISAAPLQQSSSGRLPAFSPNHDAIDSQDARPPCSPMTLVLGRCQPPALWGCALLTGSHHSWGYQRQHAAGRGHHLGHSRIVIINGHSYYCWGSFLYVPRLLSLMYRLLCNLFLSTFLLLNKSCCINSIFMFYSSSYQYYIYLLYTWFVLV